MMLKLYKKNLYKSIVFVKRNLFLINKKSNKKKLKTVDSVFVCFYKVFNEHFKFIFIE